ncbi:AmpG family muropeptide MFS transporter [Cysteiniphilum sp. JM-1]|uniref:AmpG family muropeptide MFS transporter n=1 Tax=Cysteiniphilum sp. JM-1 TaxID=2610891 RepID=UPI001CD047B1|nr:MFS transporter [Cysteiniphilum sp. JM-1]
MSGFSQQLKAATIDSIAGLFKSRKMLVMFILGYSSGLPLMLTASSLTYWYHEAGVSIQDIGLLTLVALPYTVKYLWSPVIDRISFKYFGRRKGWILLMQLLLIVCVFLLSQFSPAQSPLIIAGIALAICFFSATQDIAINAYQTEVLDEDERALGSSISVLGYRVAMMVTGAFLLIMVKYFDNNWQTGIFALIPFFAVAMIGTFLARETTVDNRPKTFADAVVLPFYDFFTRRGFAVAVVMLLIIVFYKFSDALAFSLNTVFFAELGFDKVTIAVSYKTNALIFTFIGLVLGGMLAKGFGLFRTFLLFSFMMAAANLMYMWLAFEGKNYYLMVISVAVEYMVGAMGTAVLVAMIMSLVNKSFSATQFAVLSSIDSLGRVLVGPLAGNVQAGYGWEMLFLLSFILGCIVTFGIWLARKQIILMANLHG